MLVDGKTGKMKYREAVVALQALMSSQKPTPPSIT